MGRPNKPRFLSQYQTMASGHGLLAVSKPYPGKRSQIMLTHNIMNPVLELCEPGHILGILFHFFKKTDCILKICTEPKLGGKCRFLDFAELLLS